MPISVTTITTAASITGTATAAVAKDDVESEKGETEPILHQARGRSEAFLGNWQLRPIAALPTVARRNAVVG